MSGQRTINLGIKVGTDLQPFINELNKLKGHIADLGNQRRIFNDLSGATSQWTRAVGELNRKLDETVGKMEKIGRYTANLQSLASTMQGLGGGVVPQQLTIAVPSAAALNNPLSGAAAPRTPTNVFSAFSKSHRMLLSRAMGLARQSDSQSADIYNEPSLVRARNISRFLEERARYSPAEMRRQSELVRSLESSAWVPAQIRRAEKAGRTLSETSASQLRDRTLEIERQRLTGMQLANDSLDKLNNLMEDRRALNQRFLQRQGMADMRVVNAAYAEDARREQIPQREGMRQARLVGAALREDQRRSYKMQVDGQRMEALRHRAAVEDHRRAVDPWMQSFSNAATDTRLLISDIADERMGGGRLSEDTRSRAQSRLDSLRKQRDDLKIIRNGGKVEDHVPLTQKEANRALVNVAGQIRTLNGALQDNERGWTSALKSALGFGSAVAGVQMMIRGMQALYQAAREVDDAFSRIRATVSRLPGSERLNAFQTISSGTIEDMLRTGMSARELGAINTSAYMGSKGTAQEKRLLARTMSNMQFTGSLNAEEAMGMIPAFNNAGMGASEMRAFFERANILQGTMNLDPQRMRAFMVATASGLPAVGTTASWEDTQAWALQEAAASRDMVMGQKLNRIQIALQNPRTIRRLNEILGKGGTRTTIGGEDILSIVNAGNTMQTIGKLQSLYESGQISDSEIGQVGQTLDMWNSPGTIQMLKGGLETYRKKLREADAFQRAGIVTTDEAAKEQASSLGATMDRLGASFKALTQEMSPIGGAVKSTISAFAGLIGSIAAHGTAIKVVTTAIMGLVSTIAISKGIQGLQALPGMLSDWKGARGWGSILNGGAAALGGWASLGVGAAVTVGLGISSYYADKRDERARAMFEENRVGASRVVSDLEDQTSSFQKLAKASNEYLSLLEQQKGSTTEAQSVRERILKLAGSQLKAEQLTLGVMEQQKAVLMEQLALKGQSTKASVQSKRELLSEGMLYQVMDQEQEFGALHSTTDPNDAEKGIEWKMYLARGSANAELRQWADTTSQKLSQLSGRQRGTYALEQSNVLDRLLDKQAGVPAVTTSSDRLERRRARGQELVTAGGGQFRYLVTNMFGVITNQSSTETAESVRQNAQILNQYIGESQAIDTTMRSSTGQISDRDFLLEVATNKATGGISSQRAADMVTARMARMKPDERKAFMETFSTLITAERNTAYSKGKGKGAVLSYNTGIPAELDKVLSNPELRKKYMTGFGNLEMERSEVLGQILAGMPPSEKPAGQPVDLDTGKDPFSAYRRLEQLAKQASQTGDFGTLLSVFSNPVFTPQAIRAMSARQLNNIRQDNAIKGDPERQLVEELAINSGRDQAVNFVGAPSQRKLMYGAFSALVKGGYESNGKLLLPSEQEIAEQETAALQALPGGKPIDSEGEQLFNLRLAERVARRKRNMRNDGTLRQVIASMIDRKDESGKFIYAEGERKRAYGAIDASLDMMTPGLDSGVLKSEKDRVMFEVQRIANHGGESLNEMRLSASMRGLFNTDVEQQHDLYELTGAEIQIKQEMLAKMRESADTKREQVALDQQIKELTLKQIASIEQVQRVVASTREGRAFSQAVVQELFMGDAKDRLPRLGNMLTTQVNKGVAMQMSRTLDSMDRSGAFGGLGNPLAALGRALYDPSGELEGKDIQRALLDTTRMQVQATQANTQALQENTAARAGVTPASTPAGGGSGPAIPIPGNTSFVNAANANTPTYNLQGAPVAEGLVNPSDGGSPWGVLAAGGAGAVAGMGLGRLTGGDGRSGTLGALLGGGLGTVMYYGARGSRRGTAATLNTPNGAIMVRQGSLFAGKPVQGGGKSGVDGTAYFYSQLGMTTPGVNWFSKENIVGYMDGKPVNVTGGLWKTDMAGRATGDINWGAAAGGAANIGMSAYSGWISQRGNGRAAQNWQALSAGFGTASAMAGSASMFGGAAAAGAGATAGGVAGAAGTSAAAAGSAVGAGAAGAGAGAAGAGAAAGGGAAAGAGATTAGTLGSASGTTASTGYGIPVAIVLAVAAIAASVMAGIAAAQHQADEANKAYAQREAEMLRLLAIAEEQRRAVGAAAERILSARADVNNVFSGVAASAFLSGRYSQTAPTIHVDNLVVQANNPAELSAALAQGVAREIRRGA